MRGESEIKRETGESVSAFERKRERERERRERKYENLWYLLADGLSIDR